VLLAACDVPTDIPNWEMTWNVPSKSTSINVNTLLPTPCSPSTTTVCLEVTPAGTAFQVRNVAPVTITRLLSSDCPSCSGTVAKPAFTSSASATTTLASGVNSATLTGDTLMVAIQNNYPFDPIRPGAGNTGTITITAASGSTTLGTTTLNGTTSAIPANATTNVKVPLAGAVGTGGIQVTVNINSPAGDVFTMSGSQTLVVTARPHGTAPGVVVLSGATVVLNNQSVTSAPTALNLKDISTSVTKRVQGGKIFLKINNPFALTGNLTLNITGGTRPVTKSVALAAGQSDIVLVFTKDELRAILGQNTSITFSGTVGGATAVTAGQKVDVSTRMELTLTTSADQ
jgi:hypothetical protein